MEYTGQFFGLAYTTIVSILILSLYLKYLGAEAFGLVGFFIVLQSKIIGHAIY